MISYDSGAGERILLCVDCGNTNTVFSLWDGDCFLVHWRTSTDQNRTAEEYSAWLMTLCDQQRIDRHRIRMAILSITAPAVRFHLVQFCRDHLSINPMIVNSPDCRMPVSPRVDPGVLVGSDRLANSVGAFDRHGGRVLVVDFGTATNFDIVDHDGAYIGGVIAPGVQISLKALHRQAASLPHIDIAAPKSVIGTNTVDCLQSGIYWGYVSMIEGVVKRVNAEVGHTLKVLGTGGLAPFFEKHGDIFDALEGDLTMHGLRLLHDFNTNTA